MEHIKIFNSVNEKDNFIDASSFKYDIVGLVKNVEGVVYNPPEEIIHSYVVSNVRYDASVPFDSTENVITWDYNLDKTTRSGKHIVTAGTKTYNIEYKVNITSNNKSYNGTIEDENNVQIPYSFTQGTGISDYLTFLALEDGTFSFSGKSGNTSIEYSLDNGSSWSTLTSGSSTPTVHQGEKILWKGELTVYQESLGTQGVGNFGSTNKFDVKGNIMSILYGDNFVNQKSLSGKDYAFTYLFQSCNIVNSKGLILPATTLSEECYAGLFQGCSFLETVPQLPAMSVPANCYRGMFATCTSLETVPTDLLPATNITGSYAYSSMFYNCTSLKNVPNLPMTNVNGGGWYGAYYQMFEGCESLTEVPENLLPATTLGFRCYNNMFRKCKSLVNAPKLQATTLRSQCYLNMFAGCTSLKTAPELPATTLQDLCYGDMFAGCTSLKTAPELPATTLAWECYMGMFNGCSSLNYIKAMFTTEPSDTCTSSTPCYTYEWVKGVSIDGTFVKNSAATWNLSGKSGIPNGWTIETASS